MTIRYVGFTQDLSSPSQQFNLLDVNGDGKLSKQEVGVAENDQK